MKKLIAILVVLFSLNAHAWDIEAGVGMTSFTRPVNGVWWEQGWWNEWNTKSNAAYIGATDYVNDWLRWRVGFQYLGQVSSTALVTNDGEYNGVNGCVSTGCTSMVWMKTEGSVRGVLFSLAPEKYIGNGVKVYFEGGVFAYVPKIDVWFADTRTPNDENHYEYRGGINLAPALGLGASYGKHWSASVMWYGLDATNDKPKCKGCEVLPNWSQKFGDTVSIQAKYKFKGL